MLHRPNQHDCIVFKRDAIGRLMAKLNRNARQDYAYDEADRLLSIQRHPIGIGKQLGIAEEKLEYSYDLLGRLAQEITLEGVLGYEYDPLSNLNTLTLPDGRKVNHLYYGSGHLHQINLDGQVISDMELHDLHRDRLVIEGEYPPCNRRKGKMNSFKGATGADVEYRWAASDGSSTEVWNAKAKKTQKISGAGCG